MKKYLLIALAALAVAAASCEPEIKYVEVPVEVDKNPWPDSLVLFAPNVYEYTWLDDKTIYEYVVDKFFSDPAVDYIIMSYGKSTIYSTSIYGSPLPFNCVTFIGYNAGNGMIKSADYGEYGCYTMYEQFPVSWGGSTIDNSGTPYSWDAWASGANPDFYNKNQYVVEIISRN